MHEDRTEKRQAIFYGWLIAFVSLLVTTTAFGVIYSFGVFFKGWLGQWHCSRALLSGVFSVGFLVYGVSSFFMGNLTDRYGPRKTLAAGGFIMGSGAFLTSLVSDTWLLYLTFSVMVGIGVGTSYAPTVSTVSRWFLEKKGVAVGIVVTGLGLGTLVFSPLARALVGLWNWRVAFVVFAVIIWSVFFAAALVIRRNPRDMGLEPYTRALKGRPSKEPADVPRVGGPAPGGIAVRTADALRRSTFWKLFFVHALWGIAFTTPLVHLFPYATDAGISPGQAALMLSGIGASSIVGRVALGTLGERIGTRNSLVLLLLCQMCAMLWLGFARSAGMLWAFSLFFGLSYGGLASVFPLATAEYFGVASMGSIFGLVLLGATVGGVTGPWVVGYIFDLTQKYLVGFLVSAGSTGLSALLAAQLPRRPVKGETV